MKFSNIYSVLSEAKIDDLLVQSGLSDEEKTYVKSINDLLDNKVKYIKYLIGFVKKHYEKDIKSFSIPDLDMIMRDKVVTTLNTFEKIQNELPIEKRDIYKYDDMEDVDKCVEEHMSSKKKKIEVEELSKATKVYDDDEFLVVSPETYEQSKKYGKGTQWCISAESDRRPWDSYTQTKLIKFYFFIDSSRDTYSPFYKIAVGVSPIGKIIGMWDAKDDRIYEDDKMLEQFESVSNGKFNRSMLKPKEVSLEEQFIAHAATETVHYTHITINENKEIVTDSGFHVTPAILKPFVKNGELTIKFGGCFGGGHFSTNNLNLTSMKGFPKSVQGLNINENKFTSIEDISKIAGLTSLRCNDNMITSLKGCPEKMVFLSCKNNRLTSLEGGPIQISDKYDCSNNQLSNLISAPEKVGDSFICSMNPLISLEGAPKVVDNTFECHYTKVKFTKEDVKAISQVYGEVLL